MKLKDYTLDKLKDKYKDTTIILDHEDDYVAILISMLVMRSTLSTMDPETNDVVSYCLKRYEDILTRSHRQKQAEFAANNLTPNE
jgi:hypothetical protein